MGRSASDQLVTDWADWVERWDLQQERYLPHREERIALMLDVVESQRGGGGLRILDLCCGLGSISTRVLARFPEAKLVAIDMDPVLLEIGRRTLGDTVHWRDADLRGDDWQDDLGPGSFDAVLSATAIHWFRGEDVRRIYGHLAALLASGGVFANADHFPVSSAQVAETSRRLLESWQEARLAGAEDFRAFHAATAADPSLAELAAESERRFAGKEPGEELPLAWHRDALLAAGFVEADEVWRHHSDAILVALR